MYAVYPTAAKPHSLTLYNDVAQHYFYPNPFFSREGLGSYSVQQLTGEIMASRLYVPLSQ